MIPDHPLLHRAPRNVFEEGLLYDLPRNRIPAQEQNSCPRTSWVLRFPWTSAVPLLNAFPSTLNLMAQLNQIKAYPEYFRIGIGSVFFPPLIHLAVHLKGLYSLLAAMRLCYSKAKCVKNN